MAPDQFAPRSRRPSNRPPLRPSLPGSEECCRPAVYQIVYLYSWWHAAVCCPVVTSSLAVVASGFTAASVGQLLRNTCRKSWHVMHSRTTQARLQANAILMTTRTVYLDTKHHIHLGFIVAYRFLSVIDYRLDGYHVFNIPLDPSISDKSNNNRLTSPSDHQIADTTKIRCATPLIS